MVLKAYCNKSRTRDKRNQFLKTGLRRARHYFSQTLSQSQSFKYRRRPKVLAPCGSSSGCVTLTEKAIYEMGVRSPIWLLCPRLTALQHQLNTPGIHYKVRPHSIQRIYASHWGRSVGFPETPQHCHTAVR